MRKKTKYHNTNGIVQVLKIRKKVWIALRLHLDNNFNLLAGTWRQETRHQSTPPPHSPSKKKRIGKTDWEICLITLPCEKTHSFRSLLTPHLPGAESWKAFSRRHLLWQTIRKTCSRMLRQTRRKTITIEAARTFPELNFRRSPRVRVLRETTRTRTRSPDFNGWILPVFQTGYIKKFLKKTRKI